MAGGSGTDKGGIDTGGSGLTGSRVLSVSASGGSLVIGVARASHSCAPSTAAAAYSLAVSAVAAAVAWSRRREATLPATDQARLTIVVSAKPTGDLPGQ